MQSAAQRSAAASPSMASPDPAAAKPPRENPSGYSRVVLSFGPKRPSLHQASRRPCKTHRCPGRAGGPAAVSVGPRRPQPLMTRQEGPPPGANRADTAGTGRQPCGIGQRQRMPSPVRETARMDRREEVRCLGSDRQRARMLDGAGSGLELLPVAATPPPIGRLAARWVVSRRIIASFAPPRPPRPSQG